MAHSAPLQVYAASGTTAPTDILFSYQGTLCIVCDASPAGRAWLADLRKRRPGLWNSFVGEELTLTLTRYQELTALVRHSGLTIDLAGTRGDYTPRGQTS